MIWLLSAAHAAEPVAILPDPHRGELRFWTGADLLARRRPVVWSSVRFEGCGGRILPTPSGPTPFVTRCRDADSLQLFEVGWSASSLLRGTPTETRIEWWSPSKEIGPVDGWGDFDGDGELETHMMLAGGGSRKAEVQIDWGGALPWYEGRTRLTYGLTAPMSRMRWAALRDLDGDGRDELALSVGDDTGRTAVLLVPGEVISRSLRGSLDDYLLYEGSRDGLAACDVDGDGLDDLVAAGRVWSGQDLAHDVRRPIPVDAGHVVCLRDLDGDGAEEVVSGDPEAGEVVGWGR